MKGKTAQQILDVAQELVRNRGYNAFSYADISEQVGIRKASIHYHFASKDNLVLELVKRYRQRFGRIRSQIEQKQDSPKHQLIQFTNLYQDGLSEEKLCLCGMLAADWAALPSTVQEEIQGFFSDNETWLREVLQRGCQAGVLQCTFAYQVAAKQILATLQGAQLISRASDDKIASFEQIIKPLLTQFINDD